MSTTNLNILIFQLIKLIYDTQDEISKYKKK